MNGWEANVAEGTAKCYNVHAIRVLISSLTGLLILLQVYSIKCINAGTIYSWSLFKTPCTFGWLLKNVVGLKWVVLCTSYSVLCYDQEDILYTMYICCIDDMPAGQTPHTVTLYAHHDLVDSVQPGDRWVCTYDVVCESVCLSVFLLCLCVYSWKYHGNV